MDKNKIIIIAIVVLMIAIIWIAYNNIKVWKSQSALNDAIFKKLGINITDSSELVVVHSKKAGKTGKTKKMKPVAENDNDEVEYEEEQEEEQEEEVVPEQEYSNEELEDYAQQQQEEQPEEESATDREEVQQEEEQLQETQEEQQQEWLAPKKRGRKKGGKNKSKVLAENLVPNKKKDETEEIIKHNDLVMQTEIHSNSNGNGADNASDKIAKYKKMNAKYEKTKKDTEELFDIEGSGESEDNRLSGE